MANEIKEEEAALFSLLEDDDVWDCPHNSLPATCPSGYYVPAEDSDIATQDHY